MSEGVIDLKSHQLTTMRISLEICVFFHEFRLNRMTVIVHT